MEQVFDHLLTEYGVIALALRRYKDDPACRYYVVTNPGSFIHSIMWS